MIAPLARARLHYGWVIVAVTFLTMLAAAGVRSAPSVLILPLEHEFGWDRATVSLAVSINLVLFGICGPFAAAVMERVGMRTTMAGALLLLAAAVGLTGWVSAPWQLHLLWGLLVGTGSGFLAGWVAATVSNRWFAQRRGMVVGILTVANAAGQLIFLPVLASLVGSFGWRAAVVLTAVCALVVAPLVIIFVRNYPQDVGLLPYGAEPGTPVLKTQAAENPMAAAMATLRQGLGNRNFLLLCGTFFICGASTHGLLGTHLIPASVEHGIPEVTAAYFLALMGFFNVFGTLISGWLSDRYDSRWLLAWYYGLRGLSLLFLPYAYGMGVPALLVFAVFYGLDWVATVPPTVRLAADHFGNQNVGRVYAWIFAVHQLGAAAIAYGAGSMRLSMGSYTPSFLLAGVICLLGAGMALGIEKPAHQAGLVRAAS